MNENGNGCNLVVILAQNKQRNLHKVFHTTSSVSPYAYLKSSLKL